MKVAHVSDTHLGYMQYHLRERKEDFYKAFKKVVDRVIEEGVEILIHSGDLFESYHPDIETLSFVISQFQRLKEAGIDVVAVTGNHDRALRKGVSPPHKILSDLGLVKLLDPYGELELKGIYFVGFRYFPRRFLDAFREEHFYRFEMRAKEVGLSVLVLHQAVDPFISYFSFHPDAYEVLASQLPKGFSYYAAGHIHLFRKEELHGGIFSYSGSTEFRSVSEAEFGSRGFNIFDLETKEFKRVELNGLRPFLLLTTKSQSADQELKELLSKAKAFKEKPVVSIKFIEDGEPLEKFSDILKELEKSSLYLKVLKKEKVIEGPEPPPTTLNYREIVNEFCKVNNFPSKVGSLAVEIVNHSVEDVEGIVEDFLEKELGDLSSVLKRFGV